MTLTNSGRERAQGEGHQKHQQALWTTAVAMAVSTGLALVLYVSSAAPGLTWAHYGADGGDLLAAAASNGVPHPSGYPLYILLLQAWLAMGRSVVLDAEPAWLGNLFSAFCMALTVGLTVLVANAIISPQPGRWSIAVAAALLWMVAPLPWSQALITEVYALHILLVALLGWVLVVHHGKPALLVPVLALGTAHHLTFTLLVPATIYWMWVDTARRSIARLMGTVAVGIGLGVALYLRIPAVAQGNAGPPPVNWGYADNWSGFLWVVSGQAYRQYLFGVPPQGVLDRLAAWARVLAVQFTPVGLGMALIGLGYLDRSWPRLRNFSLLWVTPISIYAIFYNTWDSAVYLLPVVWMFALWLAVGMTVSIEWLQTRWRSSTLSSSYAIGAVSVAFVIVLAIVRWSDLALRYDSDARRFVQGTLEAIEPGAILVSRSDAETFALWYATWGSGELMEKAPGTVLVNPALYQFAWYRRLLRDVYPQIPGIDTSFAELLAANDILRPIYFAEELTDVPGGHLEPAGALWRYVAKR